MGDGAVDQPLLQARTGGIRQLPRQLAQQSMRQGMGQRDK